MSDDRGYGQLYHFPRSHLGSGAPPGGPLEPPGGGGPYDGKIARLEVQVDHLKSSLDDIKALIKSTSTEVSALRETVGRIDERTDHFLTYPKMVVLLLAFFTVFGGFTLFQDHIKRWMGVSPPVQGSQKTP